MLTTILPGLRDLRTPLATGYLWLVALFLACADILPTAESESQLIGQVFDIANGLGTTAVLAVLSFVAYLLGSALSTEEINLDSLTRTLRRFKVKLIKEKYVRKQPRPTVDVPYSEHLLTHFEKYANDTVTNYESTLGAYEQATNGQDYGLPPFKAFFHGRGSLGNTDMMHREKLNQFQSTIDDEREIIANKLHSDESPLWDDYDREMAEGNFRVSITPPLLVIAMILSIRYCAHVGISWQLVVAVPATGLALWLIYTVFIRGIKRLTSASAIIQLAVVIDPTRSPFCVSLAQYTKDMESIISRR
ncbi:hypothetical protein O4160_02470 [Rhodococcus sp. IEGM 1401]|uniref:hypothetical protein n=1 Tax=unclassified Rhodococcus (in: high G+C Gram-positive bacteria) TaxID=192944 RepID=UPI0022B3610B|nr:MULTISPECIES: hypothetical protein [unclassified Rhodococcus (in: high G+C Gram-positive bacteria)]MCZ4559701.1 hypothetical protein [Rhodococcus sp. IEGM 1401]MDI9919346.1 hypothetical protein [Rhodococcus sp. IEGM 1372]MDV8032281.1 hypothetical protein [Rhodococcus sp. IEGM 1414]